MSLAGAVAGVVAAAQVAGAAPDAVASAYARAATEMPLSALEGNRRARRDILAWQVSCSELSTTQRAVYQAILLHYNHERMDAWPSYETIAAHAGCDRRTAIRSVKELEALGFLTVERRYRIENRWPGRERHHRTNVYRFADGGAATRGPRVDDVASKGDGTMVPSAEPLEQRPLRDVPPPAPPSVPAPEPRVPCRPTTEDAREVTRPGDDGYWLTFSSVFFAEHHRAYGASSNPGVVRSETLRAQASGLLLELVAECAAWAQQHGVAVERPKIADALSRQMAATWLTWTGKDDRLRQRRHPIGWICGDLERLAYGRSGEVGAVDAWKRAQNTAAPAKRTTAASHAGEADVARVRAEARALNALLARGAGFDEAVRLVRAESERSQAAANSARPPPG